MPAGESMKSNLLNNRNIYLFGLVLLVCSLPFSVFLMSVSQFILLGNWLVEGKFDEKWQRLKSSKAIWLFVSVFLVHVGWMVVSGFEPPVLRYGLNDLRIKIPLLLLPVLIGTSSPLNEKELRMVLRFFVGAVVAGTLVSLFFRFRNPLCEWRYWFPFISHIRFSLLVVLAVFFLFYLWRKSMRRFYRWGYVLLAVWLLGSLVFFRLLTGLLVFYFSSLLMCVFFFRRLPAKYRYALLVFYVVTAVGALAGIKKVHDDYFSVKQPLYSPAAYTPSGNPYFYDSACKEYENGYPLWEAICEKELRNEWNKRSRLSYDGTDRKGNLLRYTLIRYLTSRGLTKDSASVASLRPEEITAIENGMASVVYLEKPGIYQRVYEIIWELDHYFRHHDPSGHSVAQRIEYLRTAMKIIRENFWLGTGTGGVQAAFDRMYEAMNSPLQKPFRHRAHNQFVTFLVSFGIGGFLWIVFVFFYVPYKKRCYGNYLFLSAFITGMLSWLNEDTLETQAGVTFFTFFIVLFLFGIEQRGNESKKAQ